MHKVRTFAIAGVSLLAFATPLAAQDVGVPADNLETVSGTSEIIVQARRRDESLQDVPAVINAITPDSIVKLNIRRLDDIATVVPGLSLGSNANGIGSVTTIRGVQYDVNASGDAGTVQYYYNDAPVSAGVVLQGMYDVGMIEVLRGPQGTLKGRAAPSGSISITFRKPDLEQAGGYAQGTVNDINGYNLNGAINVPIVAGKLGLRIAGLVSDDDGNRVHVIDRAGALNGRDPVNRTRAGRISLRADPFDGVFVVDASYSTLNYKGIQYVQAESASEVTPGAPASPVLVRAKDRLAVNRLPIVNDTTIQNYNVQAALSLFDQRLIYVGNWARQHFQIQDPSLNGDRAGYFANPSGLQFQATATGVAPVLPPRTIDFTQPTDSRGNSDTHEIRLQNDQRIADMFDYVVGFLHYKIDSPTQFQQIAAAIPGPGGTLTGVALVPLVRFQESSEKSVFGNLTARIGEKVELSGGVRHIWYKTDAGVQICGVDFVGCTDNPALATDYGVEATIFQGSAKYQFNSDAMIYASYGTSWRPNATLIGGPTAPSPLQARFLGSPPEKSKNIEAGFKSQWFGGRLRLNVTGFYQKFDNYPYRSPGIGVYAIDFARIASAPVRAINFIAAVPVEVKGVEGDIAFDITDRWNIGAVVSYADGKIKNGSVPCLDLNGDGAPDAITSAPTLAQLQAATGADGVSVCNVTQRASSSSPFSASIQSEYSAPVSANMDGFVRGLLSYSGNSQNDPTNFFDDVKSYGLLNLYAGVRDTDGAWEITAYAKNITNAFRVLNRSNGAEFTALAGVGNVNNNYFSITSTQPREFGITARVAFGSR